MSKYFSKYPKFYYNKNLVVNILTRVQMTMNAPKYDALFDSYYIKDGETPDILSNKFYGDPEKHWIILLTNEIINLRTDYPLSYQEFIDYLNIKYSVYISAWEDITGEEYALQNLNPEPFRYKKQIIENVPFFSTTKTEEYFISKTEYDDLPSSLYEETYAYSPWYDIIIIEKTTTKKTITLYDMEYENNEKKKNIKILKPSYIDQFEQQFINLMSK